MESENIFKCLQVKWRIYCSKDFRCFSAWKLINSILMRFLGCCVFALTLSTSVDVNFNSNSLCWTFEVVGGNWGGHPGTWEGRCYGPIEFQFAISKGIDGVWNVVYK